MFLFLQLLEHDRRIIVSVHHAIQLLALVFVQECAALKRLVLAVNTLHGQSQLQLDVLAQERSFLDVAKETR